MIKKVKEIIKIIEDDGWYLKTHNGTSHRQYTHDTKKGKVTINGKLSEDLDPEFDTCKRKKRDSSVYDGFLIDFQKFVLRKPVLTLR